MNNSLTTTPKHVAILLRKSVGHHFCFGLRAGDGNSRTTLSGSTSQNVIQTLPAPTFLSTAVTFLNAGSGKRTAIERAQPLAALAVRTFPELSTPDEE